MRYWIAFSAALVGLTLTAVPASAQVAAQYYGRLGYNNDYDYDGYHNRTQRWNAYRSGRNYSPYNNYGNNYNNNWSSRYRNYNQYFNNNYSHRRSHQGYGYGYNGLGNSAYYRQPGIYYNSPGFGLRFSF